MKLGEYGLGEYGFCILSVRIQVRTVERALTIGSIVVNGEVYLFWWFIVVCGFFSLSVTPRLRSLSM